MLRRPFMKRVFSLLLTACMLLCAVPTPGLAAQGCTCTDKCSYASPNAACPHCSAAEEGSFHCLGTYPSAVGGTLTRTYGDGLEGSFDLSLTGGSGQLTLTGDKTYSAAVSGTARIRWEDVLSGEKDAGEHTLSYSFIPDSADYRPCQGELRYRVEPRSLAARLSLSGDSFVYNGAPCTPAVTVTAEGRTLTEGVEYTLSYHNNTAPGTATVRLQDVPGDNWLVSGQASFAIEQAVPSIGAVTYNGPRLLDSMAPGEVTLTREDASLPGALYISALKLAAGENSYSWAFVPQDSGYASLSGTITLTVEHHWSQGSCTQAPVCQGCGETDGTAPGHTLSYSASGAVVTETCSTPGYGHSGTLTLQLAPGASTEYTGAPVEPLQILYSDGWVGPRDLTVRYENNTAIGRATGSVTVEGATAALTFDIDPVSMEVTARDVSVTYDGEAHTGSVTAPQGARIRYGTDEGSLTLTECPAYTDAGEYTVFYRVTKENHRTVEGSFRIRIAPVALTVTVENGEKIYGEADPEGYGWRLTSGKLVGGDGLKGISFSRAPGEDVGTYAITATDSGRNGNYAITFRDGTLTVVPREIEITWENLELTYNGKEQAPKAVAGNTAFGDQLELTVSGGRTDATGGQKVTARVTGITGKKAANYKLPAEVTARFEILKAKPDAPAVRGTDETVSGKHDGTILDVTADMEYRLDGKPGYTRITGTKLEGLEPGNYFVRYRESDNCYESRETLVVIGEGKKLEIRLPREQKGYTLTAEPAQVGYEGATVLTFTLKDGWEKTESFAVRVNGTQVLLKANGTCELSDIREDLTVTVEGLADDAPAEVTIRIGNRSWNSFLSGVRFGIYYNSFQTMTITAQDEGSGVESIHYHLAFYELSMEQLKSVYNWTKYTGPVTIRPSNKYVVYARVVDKAGNTVYVNSEGIILDDTPPTIDGVRSRGVYYTTQQVKAGDNFKLSSFKLDGSICSGTIPGNPSVETRHTLSAWDAAGNSNTFTITMMPIAALGEDLPSEEELTLADREFLEERLEKLRDILARECGHATAPEKQQLQELEQRCAALLEKLEPARKVAQLLDGLPDTLTVRPDQRKYIDILDEAQQAYDGLTPQEQEMLGNRADRLNALRTAMTDYRIVEGDKGKWTEGDTAGLTFVGNGYYGPLDSYSKGAYGKFLGVEVDGLPLEEGSYSARAGSTVIILKTGYLETLESGKHTIRLCYTDGQTPEATFRISQNISFSDSGGAMNLIGILFWAALGLACLVGIILVVLLILWRKEKQ